MNQPLIDLACPKCGGTMRPQERQGIVIDLCTQCRGIFLDRGELDRLLDLEAAAPAYAGPPGGATSFPTPGYDAPPYGPPTYGPPGGWNDRRYDDDRFDDDDDRFDDERGYGRRRRSRRGFLGELLEGFGD